MLALSGASVTALAAQIDISKIPESITIGGIAAVLIAYTLQSSSRREERAAAAYSELATKHESLAKDAVAALVESNLTLKRFSDVMEMVGQKCGECQLRKP